MSTQPETLDRSVLERKARDELQQIAAAIGATVGSRAKKADIVDAILAVAGGPSDNVDTSSVPDAGSEDQAPKTPRTRVRSAGSLFDGDDLDAVDDGPAVPEPEVTAPDVDGPDEEPKAEWELEAEQDPAPDRAGGGATRKRVRTADVSSKKQTQGPSSDGSTGDKKGNSAAKSEKRQGNKDADNSGDASKPDGAAKPADKPADKAEKQGGQGSQGQNGDAGADDGDQANRKRRRRRGRDRDRDEPVAAEPVAVEGAVDLRDEGYGFLRTRGFLPSKEDCYIPTKMVRQYGLRRGDIVAGTSRPANRSEKNPAMLTIDSVNGLDPEQARERPEFEELTPLYPDVPLKLELESDPSNTTARIIDLVAPIGKGQRGLIVSPPKAGKTTVMKQIAQSIEANNPEVELIVLLIDERPEEVTDMKRSVKGTVVASTFDRPAEEHTQVAELTIERAKRMVETGKDVVIILDGITRLARAYNLAAPGTGRIMSGGIDTGALYPPKKFFGAARNVEEGGSLTILATALVDTGSKMDEVIFEEFKGTGNMELRLDRRLAERRVYPAIDVDASSTRHEELLFKRQQLQQVFKLRRVLSGLANGGDGAGPSGAGLELLVDRLRSFKNNEEFLREIAKAGNL